MECPKIIKYADINKEAQGALTVLIKRLILGTLGGAVTGGTVATVPEWKKYHKEHPQKTSLDFLYKMPKKHKTQIRMGAGLGARLGQVAALSSAFINFRKLRPGAGRAFRNMKYPTRDAFNILGINKAAIKKKSEVSAAFRRVIKMVHPDKGGTPGLSQNVKDAYDSIKKTDWYTKLAFLR